MPHRPLRFLQFVFFSSLAKRIIFINALGLLVLLFGILYLNQFREGLIDAKVKSLITQGEIISAAIVSSASADSNRLNVDAEKLLEQILGNDGLLDSEEEFSSTEFLVNPEKIGPVLSRLVLPTGTRALIFERNGDIFMDSRLLNSKGKIVENDTLQQEEVVNFTEMFKRNLNFWLNQNYYSTYRETADLTVQNYPEVEVALRGNIGSVVRMNEKDGSLIICVAVPLNRSKGVMGSLLLLTQGKDIDNVITNERLAILRVFLVAASVMVVLSLILASTIATPLRVLSLAARRIRTRKKLKGHFPDYTQRLDEVGELSLSLRDMAEGLETRIEAIERFAADVAHELKNPLTSLRSAIEILPKVQKNDDKMRLYEIIQHDVQRLDRLISDISYASRLDAELQRADYTPVNLRNLLNMLVNIANETQKSSEAKFLLQCFPDNISEDHFYIQGNDSRLGQVISNLIENARSFSPKDSVVLLKLQRLTDHFQITVCDQGCGIPEANLMRIFERFYTDRPNHSFGKNSGLGLSISKQIVEAHGGSITADNLKDEAGIVTGAIFTIILPAPEWK